MLMKNTSGSIVVVEALGLAVAAGDTIEVPDGYAKPKSSPAGGRVASVIELLAPQLEPADDAVKAKWLKAPNPEDDIPVKEVITAEKMVADGVPPGVAELFAPKPDDTITPVQTPIGKKKGRF